METSQTATTETTYITAEQVLAADDMSPEARMYRTQEVLARLAAGNEVEPHEVNPLTHCAEVVAQVHQVRKHGIAANYRNRL